MPEQRQGAPAAPTAWAYFAGFEHGRAAGLQAHRAEPNLKLSTRVFWLLLGAALGAALALGFVEIFAAERILP